MEKKANIGVIILAAGVSSRLGSPKQLLPYAGKTLLQHTLQVALDSIADTVVVVFGAHEEQISSLIDPHPAQIVINTDWQEGMASSIRCGINTLTATYPTTEGAILMLCDQPYVTPALLNDLITAHTTTSKAIAASRYGDVLGVPALFHKSAFPELLQLKGDVGARVIINQHHNDVAIVPFPKGNVDIDTPEDYEQLKKQDFPKPLF